MPYYRYNVNIHYNMFLYKKNVYKKMNLKNPKALKIC